MLAPSISLAFYGEKVIFNMRAQAAPNPPRLLALICTTTHINAKKIQKVYKHAFYTYLFFPMHNTEQHMIAPLQFNILKLTKINL